MTSIVTSGLVGPALVTGGYGAFGAVVVYASPDPTSATWAADASVPAPEFATWTYSTGGA